MTIWQVDIWRVESKKRRSHIQRKVNQDVLVVFIDDRKVGRFPACPNFDQTTASICNCSLEVEKSVTWVVSDAGKNRCVASDTCRDFAQTFCVDAELSFRWNKNIIILKQKIFQLQLAWIIMSDAASFHKWMTPWVTSNRTFSTLWSSSFSSSAEAAKTFFVVSSSSVMCWPPMLTIISWVWPGNLNFWYFILKNKFSLLFMDPWNIVCWITSNYKQDIFCSISSID